MSDYIVTLILDEHSKAYGVDPEGKDRVKMICPSCERPGTMSSYQAVIPHTVQEEASMEYSCTGCQRISGKEENVHMISYEQAMSAWQEDRVILANSFTLDEARGDAYSLSVQLGLCSMACYVQLDIPESEKHFWVTFKEVCARLLSSFYSHSLSIEKDFRAPFNSASMVALTEDAPLDILPAVVLDTVTLWEETQSLGHGEYLKWFIEDQMTGGDDD